MSLIDFLLVLLAGGAAGFLNSVVGSGTLITFPTLLALGFPPVVANTSNTVGLVAGGVTSTVSMVPELKGQKQRFIKMAVAAVIGGSIGATLLLVLPPDAFNTIVPVLIALGCVLVAIQPVVAKAVARRRAAAVAAGESGDRVATPSSTSGTPSGEASVAGTGAVEEPAVGTDSVAGKESPSAQPRAKDPWWTWFAALGTSVYGGYFGAAQGVLLIGFLGLGINEPLQRLNGLKNGVATIVNAVAALVFIIFADVDWMVALAIAIGAIIGGFIGPKVGRNLPQPVYRVIIIGVGVIAIINLLR